MKLFLSTQDNLTEYSDNINKAKEGFSLADFVNQRPELSIDEKGIAHIHIQGMLLSNSTKIDRELGATDYKQVISECYKAVADGAKCIMFHINSGGGMAQGAMEAANAIAGLPIPSVAYCDGCAASAAYKLACSTTYCIASESSIVGSIGVICLMVDNSKMLSNMGIEVHVMTNQRADLKGLGRTSLTESQIQFIQENMDQLGDTFKNHVLENRPNINEEVFRAGYYSGQKAIDLGLIDATGSEELAQSYALNLIELFSPTLPVD